MKFCKLTCLLTLLSKSLIANIFLGEPMVLSPTDNSVKIVWFTTCIGEGHFVSAKGTNFYAKTTYLTTRQDLSAPNTDGSVVDYNFAFRNEATITDLTPGEVVDYFVTSMDETGFQFHSKHYTTSAAPLPEKGLKILLTSDHRNHPNIAANLQKMYETIGKVDAIFYAGNFAMIPDNLNEWFNKSNGTGFFNCLQGNASHVRYGNTYKGAPLLQSSPIFPALGNGDMMGPFTNKQSLSYQHLHPRPTTAAQSLFHTTDAYTLMMNSFNHMIYDQIFGFPQYYATTFGPIRLVVLNATRVRRNIESSIVPNIFKEIPIALNQPADWGWGEFIFEPIDKDSAQYKWLEKELASDAFNNATYKIVMMHQPIHSLGFDSAPPFTTPIQTITKNSITYSYPKDQDYLTRDIEPLLNQAGVQLVIQGHNLLWNRFQNDSGVHFIEVSNGGNSNTPYLKNPRPSLPNDPNYITLGDPNGLTPIAPNIAPPLIDYTGEPLPYVSNPLLSCFSILDTENGCVDSYYFNTKNPYAKPIKFDSFKLVN